MEVNLGAGPDNYDEYDDWVIALCEATDGPKFPPMSRVLKLKIGLDGYYEMIEAFKKKAPQYNYPVLRTLAPLYIMCINFTYFNYGK